METKSGKFKVGEVNGVKVGKEYPFDYRVFGSLDEARQDSKWSDKDLLEAVNSWEYSSAKANEYQKVTEPYRPDTSTPEFKREQLIKNLVSTFNVPREIAEQQVDAMIANAK